MTAHSILQPDHIGLSERWGTLYSSALNGHAKTNPPDVDWWNAHWDFSRYAAQFIHFVNITDPAEFTENDHLIIREGVDLIVEWFTVSPNAVPGYLLQDEQADTHFVTYLTEEQKSRLLIASAYK